MHNALMAYEIYLRNDMDKSEQQDAIFHDKIKPTVTYMYVLPAGNLFTKGINTSIHGTSCLQPKYSLRCNLIILKLLLS